MSPYVYTIPESNGLKPEAKASMSAGVNTALAELENGAYEKMSADELAAWLEKHRQAAGIKHLCYGLTAWRKQHVAV